MRRSRFLLLLIILHVFFVHLQAQTLQVALSPDKSKVNRSTKNGVATIFFDSSIEDLSIVCTDENPNEQVIKDEIDENRWYIKIDVKKDLEEDGVCYRNFLIKCSASAEYYLTTDTIAPNQVLYYTITLPNELEPIFLEERSRNLAAKAKGILEEGDSYSARLIALSAIENAHTPQAEASLRLAAGYESANLFEASVRYATFSPDGKLFATTSSHIDSPSNTTIKIWDARNGSVVHTFGKSKEIDHVDFSADGKYIVSASRNDTLSLWDIRKGIELQSFGGHTSCVYSTIFSSDGEKILSASRDGTAKLWDIKTGKEITAFSFRKNARYTSGGRLLQIRDSGACTVPDLSGSV